MSTGPGGPAADFVCPKAWGLRDRSAVAAERVAPLPAHHPRVRKFLSDSRPMMRFMRAWVTCVADTVWARPIWDGVLALPAGVCGRIKPPAEHLSTFRHNLTMAPESGEGGEE